MQTKITDFDFYESAHNLKAPRELGAQIYEAIHILACLLNVEDRLVNPISGKRSKSIKSHPAAKLWVGYERNLLYYINVHLDRWYNLDYKMDINWQNFNLIKTIKNINIDCVLPKWITTELIQTHRSVLIQKEIAKENKLQQTLNQYKWEYREKTDKWRNKIESEIQENYHYRNLWPDCPTNLKMRYDFREKL
jgi:hypothetical protein